MTRAGFHTGQTTDAVGADTRIGARYGDANRAGCIANCTTLAGFRAAADAQEAEVTEQAQRPAQRAQVLAPGSLHPEGETDN